MPLYLPNFNPIGLSFIELQTFCALKMMSKLSFFSSPTVALFVVCKLVKFIVIIVIDVIIVVLLAPQLQIISHLEGFLFFRTLCYSPDMNFNLKLELL